MIGTATRVAAVTLAQRRGQQAIADTARDDGPIWTIERRGRAAVLTMDSWGLYNSKWDWRGWLSTRLSELKTARGLIIDLRDN